MASYSHAACYIPPHQVPDRPRSGRTQGRHDQASSKPSNQARRASRATSRARPMQPPAPQQTNHTASLPQNGQPSPGSDPAAPEPRYQRPKAPLRSKRPSSRPQPDQAVLTCLARCPSTSSARPRPSRCQPARVVISHSRSATSAPGTAKATWGRFGFRSNDTCLVACNQIRVPDVALWLPSVVLMCSEYRKKGVITYHSTPICAYMVM